MGIPFQAHSFVPVSHIVFLIKLAYTKHVVIHGAVFLSCNKQLRESSMDAATLFRAVKLFNFNFKLPKPTPLRFSTISSAPTTHRGNEGKRYDGLLLDAGGTLLQLAKPVEQIYLNIGTKYGVQSSAADIKQGFRRAFSAPWPQKLRYQGDGKPFWKLVVAEATGCDNVDYFEEVYEYYANGDAWNLPEGAHETMVSLKDSGVKLAVVSNFDCRLRKLLKDLDVLHLFDAVIISSEVGYEKPDEKIFRAALDQISVETSRAVHVGDDTKADKAGANAAGIDCWLWGKDVKNFLDIQNRILLQSEA